MKKIVFILTALFLIMLFGCEQKRTNERLITYSGDLIDVKVDDEGDWHFVSSRFGTFTDVDDDWVIVKRTGTKMTLTIRYHTWDENNNEPWKLYPYSENGIGKGAPYLITVPKNYKIEIFDD